MSSVEEALAALHGALEAVEGLRVVRGVGLQVDPPAVVIPPPTLTWNGYGVDPTDATFTIALVVAFDDRTSDELLRWQPLVAAALQTDPNVALRNATPGSWPAGGGTDLPAYLFTAEVGLL